MIAGAVLLSKTFDGAREKMCLENTLHNEQLHINGDHIGIVSITESFCQSIIPSLFMLRVSMKAVKSSIRSSLAFLVSQERTLPCASAERRHTLQDQGDKSFFILGD